MGSSFIKVFFLSLFFFFYGCDSDFHPIPKATRLFVYESSGGNNRITVYNIEAIADGENAINVLGQADFTSSGVATTQSGVSSCAGGQQGLLGQYLFATDLGNSRILVWDVDSITDGENAANVLGQPNFTTTSGGTTAAKMNGPEGIGLDSGGNRLFVAEYSNARVSVFNISTITNGEDAVNVLGQSSFTTNTCATTQAGMCTPDGIALK